VRYARIHCGIWRYLALTIIVFNVVVFLDVTLKRTCIILYFFCVIIVTLFVTLSIAGVVLDI
jgi:hypothetical protein